MRFPISKLDLEKIITTNISNVREHLIIEDEPSTFIDFSDFYLFVLRYIDLKDNSLKFLSKFFIITHSDIYYYHRDEDKFEKLKGGFSGASDIMQEMYFSNQKILAAYSAEIEKLEETLFDRKIPSYFMDLWFGFKKDVSKIEHFYFRNALVFKEFLRKTKEKMKSSEGRFIEIDQTISFQISSLSTLKSRIDSIHHYFDSIKNERLNKTIFSLTILSGVFLPLNLIVGFFGMNTEGLFFKDNPMGTKFVVLILIGLILITLLGAKIVTVIDRIILRFFLGRSKIYKNILRRLSDFDDQIKGR